MRNAGWLSHTLLGLSLAFAYGLPAAAQSPQAVGEALADLHSWLEGSPHEDRWKAYLHSGRLQAQIRKGENASTEALRNILARYESDAQGLDRSRFAQVRIALKSWLARRTAEGTDPLVAQARALAGEHVPIRDWQQEQARARLARAVQQLGDYLRPSGPHSADWREYLNFESLASQVQADAEPDLQSLVQVYRRLTVNEQGLAMPVFADVAAALENYINLLAARRVDQPERMHQAQLEQLAKFLETYAQQPSEETAHSIGRLLGSLSVADQVPRLISQIRDRYSKPNLWVQVSEDFFTAGLARQVDRYVHIDDQILEARVIGTGHNVGRVVIDLVPSRTKAVLESVYRGVVRSRTTGYRSPISFESSGISKIAGRKRTTFGATGLETDPTRACAVTDSQLQCVHAGPLVSRIASRRIEASRPAANYVAARHAEARFERTFDREAAPLLEQAKQRYQEEFRLPLVRRREFPERMSASTTDDYLQVVALKATRFQLGAPQGPPPHRVRGDLALRVHQSMLNNFAEVLVGGERMTDEDLRKRVIELRGSLPVELQYDEEEEPWSITLAQRRPISVRFEEDAVTVVIRGQEFTSGGREFRAMNVGATYKMQLVPGGSKFVRQGDIVIEPPNFNPETDRLSASQVALREILQRKFDELFKPEFTSDGLELGDQWKKVGKLRPVELSAADGWLSISWMLPAKDKQAKVPPPPRAVVRR